MTDVTMMAPDGTIGTVDDSRVDAAKAAGYSQAYEMVGQDGTTGYVKEDRVAAARQANYALTANNPGVMKAVNPDSGQVNFILPSEQDDFHNAGNAIVQQDGSIQYPIRKNANGVIAQDPLEEQQQHQKIYNALNSDEKARTNHAEMVNAGEAGLGAAGATAGGAGLAYAAPAIAPVVASAAASKAGKYIANKVLGGTAMYAGAKIAKKTGLIDKIMEWF